MHKVSFDVISLYPNAFENLNNMGVITRAIKNQLISINVKDLRESMEMVPINKWMIFLMEVDQGCY